MEIPPGRFDQLLKALLYPSAYLEALKAEVAQTKTLPTGLWHLILIVAALGAFVFGCSAGLVITSWSMIATGAVLLVASSCGWLVTLPLLVLGSQGPPCWQRFHGALMGVLTGEMIFECGMVLNGLFWAFDWLTDAQALTFNILWLGLADVAVLLMIVSLWRSCGASVVRPIAVWIGVFHPIVITMTMLLGKAFGLEWLW